MKKLCLIVMSVCALSLIMPATGLAAKADGKKAKLLTKYDTNKNGVIDGDEIKAIQEEFAKDKNGELKAYDKDGDGKLSDEEVAAIKPGSGKAKEAGTKGKKKAAETAKPDNDSKAKKEGDVDKAKPE